jgi:hypothetical protein
MKSIVVDRSRLPSTIPLLLDLEDDGRVFPLVDLRSSITPGEREEGAIIFLERTKIETMLGCCRGVLTRLSDIDCEPRPKRHQRRLKQRILGASEVVPGTPT